jgi:hypothetical protein
MNRLARPSPRRVTCATTCPHQCATNESLAQSIHTSGEAAIRIIDGTENPLPPGESRSLIERNLICDGLWKSNEKIEGYLCFHVVFLGSLC